MDGDGGDSFVMLLLLFACVALCSCFGLSAEPHLSVLILYLDLLLLVCITQRSEDSR